MNTTTAGKDSIVQEAAIKAKAERIFDALTSPAELLRWWRVTGKFQAAEVECDLRPGGKWRMRVADSSGTRTATVVYGEYLEIARPSLLVYTWIREDENSPATTVRWELKEKDGVTAVRLTHSGFASESHRARNSGWPMILEALGAYVRISGS
jgi:uncharacterized protein YndB with AHSA1/START domain